ncbi:BlaI/MecI/CopY family transcriptional regulator [Spongiactinospora rosea]|uniref:BlaI/MecI/CopY family transcriptional regulator n=1 Tax=Spongiactinospora rosea TaxID=2248750 RepID=A0A366LMD2_9ACTN|nr:BlaI/MecI/CopY family transcriptional regulator [Spongiactinospora rosea]RBQ14977.1 BlaI/MecI/CopY family transcriptional regulator [Spongiactinospora rosea]
MNSLGELERSIMDVLWGTDAWLTVREVVNRLSDRDNAYTTVMTVLNRLVRKDFVRRERDDDGRTWRYRPAAGRETYIAELMLAALGETGDRLAALGHFARSVTPEEAEALRRALPEGGAP